jgi:hypothetical protein
MVLPIAGRLTPNQGAGLDAYTAECCRLAPPGHPLATVAEADEAASRMIGRLERERMYALWGGEAGYAVQHCLSRAVGLTAVLGLRERHPGSAMVVLAHRHLVGWWRAVATLALDWRGRFGVVRGVGDRLKAASVDQAGGVDPRGLDILAQAIDPRPPHELHPRLVYRLLETSVDDDYYRINRQHHRWLILELRALAVHLFPLLPPHGPRAIPRLQEATYWRRDPGIHLLMPTVIANPDSDGNKVHADPVIRWVPGEGYRTDPGPASVPKGVSATWEQQESAAGVLVRDVHLGHIQGVRAGTHLPHPDGAVPLGGGWTYAGPGSPPYPLPSEEELGEISIPPPPPPPPPPPEVSLAARRHLQHARTRIAEATAHLKRPGERASKKVLAPLLLRAQRQLALLQSDLRIEMPVDDPEADA